jgi:WD40 repeat protein
VASGSRLATFRSSGQEFVGRVTFSADGALVASGSLDGSIWLWNVATHEQHAVLRGHQAYVIGLSFSPDARLLVSGSSFYDYSPTSDTSVRIWDVETGEMLRTLVSYPSAVRSARFNLDGTMFAVALADGTIRLWGVPDAP